MRRTEPGSKRNLKWSVTSLPVVARRRWLESLSPVSGVAENSLLVRILRISNDQDERC